jgi:hypothetical protein
MPTGAAPALTAPGHRNHRYRAPGPDIRGRVVFLAGALLALGSCGACGTEPSDPPGPSRSYRMGFSPLPPRNDQVAVFQSLELWTQRADAGIMHVQLPWAAMLAGSSAVAEVTKDPLNVANYYRGKGLQVVVMLDPTDGLDRTAEAPELVAAHRSLSEPAIQQLYRQYAVAIATLIHPEYLGLAAETNLIRAVAPSALYQAVVQATNAAGTDVRAQNPATHLFISVQVETAWGLLPHAPGFLGIADDLKDFPFTQAIGLSSYPYAAWPEPAQLPLDYYSRVRGASGLPLMVVEGGWTSASVSTVVSDPVKQAAYIRRQAALLDQADALYVFQLTFTDLDLGSFPPPIPSNLSFFASLGLVDADLRPKPSLSVWDSLYSLKLR